MNISVVSATYNRASLLDNALQTYSKQKYLQSLDWEYILVDDMSTDFTREVVEKWHTRVPIRYFTSADLGLPKDPSVWRDGCPLINRASTFANGEVLILTHPEIMIPVDAIRAMYDKTMGSDIERWWVTSIPYWLPQGALPKGWMGELDKLRSMPGFYDPSWPDDQAAPMTIDYTNNNQETRDTWESWVFNGIRMRDWRWLGGFQEFKQWGSVDIDQANRRRAAGIKTVFACAASSHHTKSYLMVYHQWHDSPRDSALALKGVHGKEYHDAESARRVGGLYQIYYHGPRERANTPKTTQGILGDHLARYEFAAGYSHGKTILDIPCGTGYGAKVLADVGPGFFLYTGIDIDQESIEYANQCYGDLPGVKFMQGDMLDFSTLTKPIDLLLCFEGIEHIEDKAKFVDQMYSALVPGGTFIISTPNPANAHGTAWDKYMISPDKLRALFKSDKWVNLDWFYQESYSVDKVKVQPGRSKTAQIIILGGTRK